MSKMTIEEINEINEKIEALETEMGKAEVKKVFAQIIEAYKDYDTSRESKDGDEIFEIKNPHWNENIKVVDDGEITVYFSYQHLHLEFMEPSATVMLYDINRNSRAMKVGNLLFNIY